MALYFGRNKIGKVKTGVAGKTEDLTSVLDAQESKLNALIASLDGKAAGGSGSASVETCTVEIVCTAGQLNYAVFTCFENGQFITKSTDTQQDGTLSSKTFENVVCGSGFVVDFYLAGGAYGYNVTGVESVTYYIGPGGSYYGTITAKAGNTASIELYDND